MLKPECVPKTHSLQLLYIQGGSNMTGTNCDLFIHEQARSYLNHPVHGKRSHNKPYRLRGEMDGCASILTFDFRHNYDGRVVSSTRNLPQKEIPWYSFLLQAEWTPGLLNVDRRLGHLEFPRTQSEIESGTSSLEVPCLNQLYYTSPPQ
jgi:hypothetical protein